MAKAQTGESARIPPEKGGLRFMRFITESWLFRTLILVCIIANAAVLGIDAQLSDDHPWQAVISELDVIFLGIFTVELVLEFLAQGPRRYFRDGWNLFDMAVVGLSYVSMAPYVSALRTLRVIRVLRLISGVPQMRRVIEALVGAMPGMFATVGVLLIVFYIGAVIATTLFGAVHPEFATLGQSALTLFQLTQFDGWGEIVNALTAEHPWAWAFFLVFVIVAAFAVLNLFVGVIVDAVQDVRDAERAEREKIDKNIEEIEEGVEEISVAQTEAGRELDLILAELRALRKEVAALRGSAPPG